MKILIGGVEYAAGLDTSRPLTIERKLNAPSTCWLWLTLPSISGLGAGLAAPVRNQGISVVGDDGTVYFTGYLAVSPLPEFAGLGIAGPVYRLALEAVSDEILLDTQLLPPSAGTTGATVGALLTTLVARTGSTALHTTGLTLTTPIGHFVPEAGAKWSEAAGQVAGQARAAYRAMSGALKLTTVGTTVHALSEGDGSLELAGLTLTPGGSGADARALANDVTVCGAEEPVAYVTEFFRGDGVTASFGLQATPYFGPASTEKVIHELFNEAVIDLRRWGFSGRDEFFSLSGGGLAFNGGTGVDGDAALVWMDGVEAGGTLLLEASGVSLSPGSTGTVGALFAGVVTTANCVAGFQVTAAAGTGAVSVAPLVDGVVVGATLALDPARQYTFRTRVWCPEVERIQQMYRVVGDGGLAVFGGGGVVAAGHVLMEVEATFNGIGSTPVVLYDGAVGFLPGSFTVAAASSLNLIGTMRSLFLTSLGTGWVSTVPTGGAAQSNALGALSQAGQCEMTRAGVVTFYPGYVPPSGSTIEVRFRAAGRAVGRAVNAASQAELLAAGAPATAVWTGLVTQPKARSSQDCRNAALALVMAATSLSAAWSGTYRTTNIGLTAGTGGDVWPGDALLLTAPSVTVNGVALDAQVAVRAVRLEYRATTPDVVGYAIQFSNDWANDLAIRTSRTVPSDAWLPAVAGPVYLANLNALVVTGITASAITVSVGVTPPVGGGFEVRRRDFAFQPGTDADLVMRSAVANFDIPRSSEAEQFFIRMYDAGEDGTGTAPHYSEFSAALVVNLPLAGAAI